MKYNSGVKDGVTAPPTGTRVSFFERSLLEPNSARLSRGPEGNNITHLIPVQRSPRVLPGSGKVQPAVHSPMLLPWALWLQALLASHGPSCRPNDPSAIACCAFTNAFAMGSLAPGSFGLSWSVVQTKWSICNSPCAPFPPHRFDPLVAIVT